MFKRLLSFLCVLSLVATLTGCCLIWGDETGSPLSKSIAESKDASSGCNGEYFSSRHFKTHMQVILDDLNDIHKFWDRYFMNYDWDDPRYN